MTDGETNASLRAGDAVESLTLDRAVELLAERRAKGPGQEAGTAAAQVVTHTSAAEPANLFAANHVLNLREPPDAEYGSARRRVCFLHRALTGTLLRLETQGDSR